MAKQILIRFSPQQPAEIEWTLRLDANSDDSVFYAKGTPQEFLQWHAALSPPILTIILIPSVCTGVFKTHVPGKSRQQLAQAIPYAFEDESIEALDQLHITFAAIDQANQTVITINKALLGRILCQLVEAGIQPMAILPDYLALPSTEKGTSWQILLKENEAIIRLDDTQGFACESDQLERMIKQFLQNDDLEKPTQIVIHSFNKTTSHPTSVHWPDVETQFTTHNGEQLAAMQIDWPRLGPFNLLHGDFRASTSSSQNTKLSFYAKTLSLSIFAVLCTGYLLEYLSLSLLNHRIENQITTHYKEIFPNAPSLVEPKLRIEREINRLASTETGTGFLLLLAKSGDVLKKMPTIQLQALNFRQEQLTLRIHASDFNSLEQFVNQLRRKALRVEQTNATRLGNEVSAEIAVWMIPS